MNMVQQNIKAKILVADDEQGIRDLLKSELGICGYSIDTASDGEEAIEKIKQDRYDIVITDIKMPKADGLKVLASVKKVSPETEVIMATGYATVENAVSAMKEGAYDFVQKPFNVEEVSVLVERALEKSELKTLIALYESSKAIFSSLKLEKLFPIMINLLKNVIKADEIALLLFDNQNQMYLAAASFSLVYYPHKGSFITLAERLFSEDRLVDAPAIFRFSEKNEPMMKGLFQNSEMQSIAAYPVRLKDRKLGVLMVCRTRNHSEFSSSDIRNLSIFVSQIAQSIANTKLYEKLEIKISELEGAYKQLEQTRRQLVLIEKMSAVDQVASSIANQLNGPIKSVMDYTAAVLKKKSLSAELKEQIEKIRQESLKCKDTVENLLRFSSHKKAVFSEIDVNKVIKEIIELMEYELQDENINLELELNPETPKVKGDSNQIKQVLLNLLVNAQQSFVSGADAKGDRTVVIRTSSEEGQVYVEVNDNGCGIDSKTLGRIFDPFFTTKDPQKNIGLGLSISYGIIEQHNGKIHVKSAPKEGSSFIVNIPSA
ncbi:MAG: response regulator [Endomicrobiales bacterium]|nr:response regulator [Endomicrobiales bacterium]